MAAGSDAGADDCGWLRHLRWRRGRRRWRKRRGRLPPLFLGCVERGAGRACAEGGLGAGAAGRTGREGGARRPSTSRSRRA
eukprot:3658310-Rhodomonas_salina.2